MSATLRVPEAADWGVIASWVGDAESCLRWAGPLVPFPFTAAELPRLLAVPSGQSYCLAEGSARPVGFGQHRVRRPGAVHLARIIIAPAARGRGLGRLLCRLLIGRAIQATSAAEVTLYVFRDNTAALSLYSSLGFSAVEAESTQDSLFMRREANPQGGVNGRQPGRPDTNSISGAAASRRSP